MSERDDYADPDPPRHWTSVLLDLTVLWFAIAVVGAAAIFAHFVRN